MEYNYHVCNHRMLLLLLTTLLIYLGPTAPVTPTVNPPLTSVVGVVRVETQCDLGILVVVAVCMGCHVCKSHVIVLVVNSVVVV